MIDTSKILAMIDHWLSTEMHAYFGSDYGADLNSLLLTPLDSPVADRFISKMKKDIPVLQQLNSDQISIYSETEGFETNIIYLTVGGIAINLNKVKDNLQSMALNNGETYNVESV